MFVLEQWENDQFPKKYILETVVLSPGRPGMTVTETAEFCSPPTPKLSKAGVPTHGEHIRLYLEDTGDL